MKTTTIEKLTIRRVKLPLTSPYILSYRTFNTFEPIIVELALSNGGVGWGEGHISPGSSSETRDAGWEFVNTISRRLIGEELDAAISLILQASGNLPVAKTSLTSAIEMARSYQTLKTTEAFSFPILTPFNATNSCSIGREIEMRLNEGFRTFKIKVGKDVDQDLSRVAAIQNSLSGRATLRLDANRAYSVNDAIKFIKGLNSEQIELFEQPCNAEDWDANAEVAKLSSVPVMLDEPICSFPDIDRAALIKNVSFCKLKLKRFGSLARLESGLSRVQEHGMQAVLGDGLGGDIACWM